jgi:hypothetical protein
MKRITIYLTLLSVLATLLTACTTTEPDAPDVPSPSDGGGQIQPDEADTRTALEIYAAMIDAMNNLNEIDFTETHSVVVTRLDADRAVLYEDLIRIDVAQVFSGADIETAIRSALNINGDTSESAAYHIDGISYLSNFGEKRKTEWYEGLQERMRTRPTLSMLNMIKLREDTILDWNVSRQGELIRVMMELAEEVLWVTDNWTLEHEIRLGSRSWGIGTETLPLEIKSVIESVTVSLEVLVRPDGTLERYEMRREAVGEINGVPFNHFTESLVAVRSYEGVEIGFDPREWDGVELRSQ